MELLDCLPQHGTYVLNNIEARLLSSASPKLLCVNCWINHRYENKESLPDPHLLSELLAVGHIRLRNFIELTIKLEKTHHASLKAC